MDADSPSARRFLEVQRCLVPGAVWLGPEGQKESLRLVLGTLRGQPAGAALGLKVLLFLLEVAAVTRHGRAFNRLNRERQRRLLGWFFDSPIPLLRKGFWGLNTLAKLGYYGQSAIYPKIGYRPTEEPPR
jgi:hypothetical protein